MTKTSRMIRAIAITSAIFLFLMITHIFTLIFWITFYLTIALNYVSMGIIIALNFLIENPIFTLFILFVSIISIMIIRKIKQQSQIPDRYLSCRGFFSKKTAAHYVQPELIFSLKIFQRYRLLSGIINYSPRSGSVSISLASSLWIESASPAVTPVLPSTSAFAVPCSVSAYSSLFPRC